jgi:aconitate hydratase
LREFYGSIITGINMLSDTFKTLSNLNVGTHSYAYYSLKRLEEALGVDLRRLPYSLRILLENLLRKEDGRTVRRADIESFVRWNPMADPVTEISFMPARVLLQDFTGVPCVVDLAVMRDAIVRMGGNPEKINPLQPVDLVIDHSVQVDEFGTRSSLSRNTEIEFSRNRERYTFLRWGQQAFHNFRVVPPGTGIVHQINLEYLAGLVFTARDGDRTLVYPDSLVGTDSHTTMINGLGVLGWGVGGIEAEAAMLGQPVSMLIPKVVGFRLSGSLKAGATATDLVLTITQMLRRKGVVGKFVEYYGPGLASLSLADRATIANMAPEYGATMGFFPADEQTIKYLSFSGRDPHTIALAEAYLREQGLFSSGEEGAEYSEFIELDLGEVEPALAGPKRPQDLVRLSTSKTAYRKSLVELLRAKGTTLPEEQVSAFTTGSSSATWVKEIPVAANDTAYTLKHGSVVLAAITSCTNTSNPSVMVAAGILARKARSFGLKSKPWVKTSLAPGSKVVTAYLEDAGLAKPLDELGFNLVGYGCTTCIGNSGPLPPPIAKAIQDGDLVAVSVLSGNRNFEGRVNQHVRANYLASPPLVVAYAIAGTMDIDFESEPVGLGSDGKQVFLRDIWPTAQEVEETIRSSVKSAMFRNEYANVFAGDANWKGLPVPSGARYAWESSSTYIKAAPFFDGMELKPSAPADIAGARVLAVLGDSVTTDHISPAGSIPVKSPAGQYLVDHGVAPEDFNSYGARRGNHEVMMRGTFANIRLRNMIAPGTEGGWTIHPSSKEPMPIFDASVRYQAEGIPLIVIAGKEYGSGSSRDWAAKGPRLLGIKAVIAESFERIHRSNLVGLGILPLQFEPGQNRNSLGLTGFEVFGIQGIAGGLSPMKKMSVVATRPDGKVIEFSAIARIDTPNEVDYYLNDGILKYVLRSLVAK